MGQDSLSRIPYTCLPCQHDQLIRQRLPHLPSPPVLVSPQLEKTDISRFHRLPQYRKIFHHQHTPQEESMHNSTHTRRDKGMAIHHFDETHLPHRLSWHRSTKYHRHARRHPPSRCGQSGECGESSTIYACCPCKMQTPSPRTDIPNQ